MNRDLFTDLKKENNKAFALLYKDYFGSVKRFITKNSGSTNDAEDIFQETMVVLVEKLRQTDFQVTASIKTYIFAISKNLWLKKLRVPDNFCSLSDNGNQHFFEEIETFVAEEKNYSDKLHTLLSKITTHCNNLITDIFFRKKSIQQVQQDYGYSSIHNAQNQKFKCVEQIRKVMKEENKKN